MSTRKYTDQDLARVIEALEGTCNSLDNGLADVLGAGFEDMETADLEYIDGRIFCCSTCDWWSSVEEQSGDGETCRECSGEGEE